MSKDSKFPKYSLNIGGFGNGKSTMLEKLAIQFNEVVAERDEFREMLKKTIQSLEEGQGWHDDLIAKAKRLIKEE